MSDTPRTDYIVAAADGLLCRRQWVEADFARQLERENAALRADKARLDGLENFGRSISFYGPCSDAGYPTTYVTGCDRGSIDRTLREISEWSPEQRAKLLAYLGGSLPWPPASKEPKP